MISLENFAFLTIFYYNQNMKVINLAKKFKQSSKRLLFTTSVHLQSRIVNNPSRSLLGSKLFHSDFSEIEGFDNIRDPKAVFFESQKEAAEIYGAKKSFYLYNGSGSGILASMLAVLKDNDRVLLARNVHESVINGLILCGASPVWLMPEKNEKWDLFSKVDPTQVKKILENDKKIKALILTSPTYEGIKSDISEISKICKEHKVCLIVDEAHGALWNFSESLPETAIEQGADLSIQSLHKNASALNQGAILHLSKSSAIYENKIQQCLNLVCTTSPSFPVLASVEGAVCFLNSKKGRKKLDELLDDVFEIRKKLSKLERVEILENDDPTRIFVQLKGLSGFELSDILFEKFKIEDELCNSKGVLLICGVGTDKKKLDRLYRAFKKIPAEISSSQKEDEQKGLYFCPKMKMTPREAFLKEGKNVKKEDAIGMISKETVSVYPPGIAFLVVGEEISAHHLEIIDKECIEVVCE